VGLEEAAGVVGVGLALHRRRDRAVRQARHEGRDGDRPAVARGEIEAARHPSGPSGGGERLSARFARANARRIRDRSPARGGRQPEVEVVPQAVESWIGELPEGAARVVVDPPRSGLAMAVRRALVERRPERLTYVSCHAATLARDLAQLTPAFAVESVVLLDLFPQTGHMETVVQMVRR